jgi:hypothetical protein
MLSDARWLLMSMVTLGTLVTACTSSSFKTPRCNEPQICVYNQQDDGVCHQSCIQDAGVCASGQICTGASVCCTDTPGQGCSSPLAFVCCPPSGC